MSLRQLLFSFEGRINRQSFWLAMIGLVAFTIILFGLGAIFAAGLFGLEAGAGTFDAAAIVFLLLCLPLIWIELAVGAKRLHDRDKPAWWLLVFYLLPVAMIFAGRRAGVADMAVDVATFALLAWAFIELGCLRGTAGPNRFGPDPLEVGDGSPPGSPATPQNLRSERQ